MIAYKVRVPLNKHSGRLSFPDTMDLVKQAYGITKPFSLATRPEYTYYSVRKGTQPLPTGTPCRICKLFGQDSVFGPVDVSAKGHQYQPVSSFNLRKYQI